MLLPDPPLGISCNHGSRAAGASPSRSSSRSGAGLISVILLLYIGGVLFDWRSGILLFLGILLLTMIISGVVLNTAFLVREIRRNEQHDVLSLTPLPTN